MRLTKWINGKIHQNDEQEFDLWEISVIKKLAAYEDTGLAPEAVKSLRESLIGAISAEIAEEQGYVEVNRAKEIACAEAEGRLVILPCKVGDAVYRLSPVFDEIETGKITMIQQKADGTWKFRVTTDYSHDVTIDAIGKTVFLSREEAEAALKGRQHDV